MSFTPRTLPILAFSAALAFGLAGCSKKETDAAAPAANPQAAQAASEDAITVKRGEEVKLPPAEQKSVAEQAQTLRGFIADKPECQPFLAQLDQASLMAESGQPVTLDMGKLMDEAYQAGCQK